MRKKDVITKQHSNQDEELLTRVIALSVCYCREIQHCAWMLQYELNCLEQFEIDCDKIAEKKGKVFNLASDMSLAFQSIFEKNVDAFSKPNVKSYVRKYLYDDIGNLEDIDEIIRKKAIRLYDEKPLDFETGKKYPIECKNDFVGDGRFDEWLPKYGMTKKEREEMNNHGKIQD